MLKSVKSAFLAMALIVCCVGCSSSSTEGQLPPSDGPLTVEQWSRIPGIERFTPETLDRLRLHDESLKDKKKWSKFMKDVVEPELNKELGGTRESGQKPS